LAYSETASFDVLGLPLEIIHRIVYIATITTDLIIGAINVTERRPKLAAP